MERRPPVILYMDAPGYREELKTEVEHTRALVAQGDRTDAAAELQKIDARFGGLAAPFYDLVN